jgi:Leucine-rich repeat (LRR) protein
MFTTKSLVMKILVVPLMLLFLLPALGQESVGKTTEQEEKARMELQKKREAMMRAYERDPKRFMDSVRRVREADMHEEALKGIERYASNSSIDTIKVLDLSYGLLDKLPDFVFEATSVEKLILNGNKISKLPWKLRKLERLTTVEWNNNIVEKRMKVSWLPTLEKLSMVGNEQEKMPAVSRLKNLKYLDFSSNDLEAFPVAVLSKCDSLKEVVIKENPLEIGESNYEKLASIQVLKLNKCGIDSIHASFYDIPNLRELQLQENDIKRLPEGISKLKNLSKVSFYKCQLEGLPKDFFKLPNLVIADLYYNQLKVIPNSIDKAQKIEVLFLSHNQIYEVPEEIGELPQLVELYLHNNKLSYLPQSLSQLRNLRVLRVNNNLFQEFPDQILSLANLTDLDLDDNLLDAIPVEIRSLTQLNLFTFDGNPINFRDQRNRPFMEAVHDLQQSGTVCKPHIDMNFVDDAGNDLPTGQGGK